MSRRVGSVELVRWAKIPSTGFRRVPPGRRQFGRNQELITRFRSSRSYFIHFCGLFPWPAGCHSRH
eukprot:11953634-Alexandrium_andersonii.AAC.1